MYVPDDVPQYMSDGTKELILAKNELVAESHRKSLKKADVDLTRECYKIPEQVENSPSYSNFRKIFPNVVDIHTSGHADRNTLKRVIETIKPKEIIGIHKEESASIESLFNRKTNLLAE